MSRQQGFFVEYLILRWDQYVVLKCNIPEERKPHCNPNFMISYFNDGSE